jgi:aryl-alcohol dehydrogenase-like predicted oxidoreductase
MEKKRLGKSELKVSVMGLGCMGMSEFYGRSKDEESSKTIHRALDVGINFLDTADMYGMGKNEEFVGKVIRERREKVILATKFGVIRGENGSFLGRNGSPEYVPVACEASLRRLGVDYIDLYYLHGPDPKTPIEETIGAMSKLVTKGHVRYIGISNIPPEGIRRAYSVHPIVALQSEYSIWDRAVEAEVIPVCRELGIGFVCYSPLGRGALTGHIKQVENLDKDDARRSHPRFLGENFQKNLLLINKIEELAREKGCRPSQLALAWLLAQGKDIVPIPGTKTLKYLEENLGALTVKLTAEDLARIDKDAPVGIVAGAPYPERQ